MGDITRISKISVFIADIKNLFLKKRKMQRVIFSIKDISKIIKDRQKNEFDSRFAVVGDTGDGKSTLLSKIFYKLGKFNPWKHQVYSQKDVIKLLTNQTKGKCFDDEGINTGYKRDWQKAGQQRLIKILTNYRDSLNSYGCAIPNFFTLDKDLRDLFFMVLHVIERGVAIVHLPLQGSMYGQDKWDAKNNAKVEQKWNEKRKKNPAFNPPYWRLSTFAGYLYFNRLTPKQEALYKEVKHVKRSEEYEEINPNKEETFYEKIFKALIDGKLSQAGLLEICLMENRKYSTVTTQLNIMLRDRGYNNTLGFYWKKGQEDNSNSDNIKISSLVPTFPRKSD